VLGCSCRLLLLSSRTLLRARCVKLGRAPPTTPPSSCCTEGSRPRAGPLVSTASAVPSYTVAGPLRQAGPGSADYPRPRPAVLKALVLALGPRSGRDPPALRAPRARAGDSTTKLAGRAPEAPVPTRTTRRCLGPTWSLLDASRDPNAT
jgi:hypothetical protein